MKNKISFVLDMLLFLTVFLGAMVGTTPAPAQDQPTIAKDSVVVNAHTFSSGPHDRAADGPSWLPGVAYRVNGPIASGSQLWVEFSLPTNKQWLKLDCYTSETKSGDWWKTSCGRSPSGQGEAPQGKSVSYTGPVNFAIHMRNELQGNDVVLFSGKFKVAIAPIKPGLKVMEYYVDQDWTIPIGYIGFVDKDGNAADAFQALMWFRGNPGDVDAHLFYQGKELAHNLCRVGENSEWNPAKHEWWPIGCKFRGVYRTPPGPGSGEDPRHAFSDKPGDYEIKVLSGGHLARSLKFTVNAEGNFDNGIATSNHLGTDRVIVPVQVIGDQGPWNRLAWKTDALYGNPLTGFTPQ